jgi:hypothetical protein
MRSTQERKADALEKLEKDADVWVATGDEHGDPGADGRDWVYILLRPAAIQVWRDVAEITGRTVMRAGAWLA